MEILDIKVIKGLVYAHIKFWSVVENDYLSMSVLIDTGARVTTFSNSALKKLGYSTDNKTVTVRTGGGVTIAYIVQIPKIQIGSVELTDITAHSNDFLDEFKINGILGMNVLCRFKFSFDLDENVIGLAERRIFAEV